MDVEFQLEGFPFVWDANKAETNKRKHGVSFPEACEVFFDPFYQMYDASRSQQQRYLLLGYSNLSRLLAVVTVEMEAEAWRIISARKATASERARYEKEDEA